jgi:hypothetical protein
MARLTEIAQEIMAKSTLPAQLEERAKKLRVKLNSHAISLEDYLSLSDNAPDFTDSSPFLKAQFKICRNKEI